MSYTEKQVRAKVTKFVDKHPTLVAAAKAAKITKSELSIAVNGGRIPAKLLKAAGLKRVEVYTDV